MSPKCPCVPPRVAAILTSCARAVLPACGIHEKERLPPEVLRSCLAPATRRCVHKLRLCPTHAARGAAAFHMARVCFFV